MRPVPNRSGGQSPSPAVDDRPLAVQLGEMARSLHEESPETLLPAIVQAAVELIPGAEEASLSVVVSRKNIQCQSPSSDLPEKLDAVQMELGEGPCLHAIYDQHTVSVPTMSAETRWPRFAEQAMASGVRSMLAFQLYVHRDNLGALNLYSSQDQAFTPESELIGSSLASHAALALAESQKVGQLHQAVATRDLIGQAKGILMERYKITGHEAFLLLVRASTHTNRKLYEIAGTLVHSGELRSDGE